MVVVDIGAGGAVLALLWLLLLPLLLCLPCTVTGDCWRFLAMRAVYKHFSFCATKFSNLHIDVVKCIDTLIRRLQL